jgi:hypothetical protein
VSAATSGPTSFRQALSGGPRAVGIRVLGRTVYRRLEWLELRIDGPLPDIEPLVPLASCFLGEADVGEMAALRPDLGSVGILARLANDDRCFGTRHDGRLVSMIWISTGVARIEYLALVMTLPAGTAYWYDSWTDPSMRGLRVASSCGVRSCRAIAAEGFRVSAAAVSAENEAGMANVHAMGFRPVATLGWFGVGSVRRSFRRRRGSVLQR